MTSSTGPSVPPIIAGRYRPLRELGRGGFGVVYLVEHVHTGDRLALKILHGQAATDRMALERFQREARASARIKSEHVVKITDADAAPELGGAPFLVMELLEGKDLEQFAEERGPLRSEEVVGVLSQAAKGLDKAHALGIVHRDLKPENMFLHRREDGSAILKILDFGISKSLGDSSGDIAGAGMTSTGAVLGTPYYMSPEQARGLHSSITPATDVWPMALIAYRLLTGHVYWRANTVTDLLVQIVASDLPPPSSLSPLLPAAFDGWFARSMSRAPAARFQSVGEQVNALAVALGVVAPQLPSTSGEPARSMQFAATAVSGPPSLGARSTTAALSRTRPTVASRSRAIGWISAGVAALALVGTGVTFVLRSTGASPAAASAPLATASASAVPLASFPPMATPVSPVTSMEPPVASSAPPSVPVPDGPKTKGGRPAASRQEGVPRPAAPATPTPNPPRAGVFNPDAP